MMPIASIYQELFIPGSRDPIIVLHNILEAGIFSEYMLYEDSNEVRIAGNSLYQVLVHQDYIFLKNQETSYSEVVKDPFKQVDKLLASLSMDNWTAYGYIAFDIVRYYYNYTKAIPHPLLCFFVPETEIRFTSVGVYIKTTQSIELIEKLVMTDSQLPNYVATSLQINSHDSEIYQKSVNTLIAAIQAGKLDKAILSRAVNVSGDLDILGTYVVASKANNSVRSYCLKIEDICAIGFSPETIMEINANNLITTNPLAGTRPRGLDLGEDDCLYKQLFTDSKEVKEHALSVLLAQNEINSICLPGTTHIINFMEVKQYAFVQHLSSRVRGQLKSDKTLWDALKVLFPGITVTGISKDKALDWIEHLEKNPRGIYAGAIGWISSDGMADLALAIRSVYQYGSNIYLNAGAGIVAESVTQSEYIESVNKLKTMSTNLVLKPPVGEALMGSLM